MKLIANGLNGRFLREVLPGPSNGVDSVLAAIAYGSDEQTLLKNCVDNGFRLDIWMRYDHTVPVNPSLLRKFLACMSQNIFCYQIPDVLHAKVIWWQGYGAYIGSANLSNRAWSSNIEAGLFLSESEMEDVGLNIEVHRFFENLRSLPQAFPLTIEIVKELERMRAARLEANKVDIETKRLRTIPEYQGLLVTSARSALEKQREVFQREWSSALSYLAEIASKVTRYRPRWVDAAHPATWQADQMLHAYYYNLVREGRRHPYNEFYERNKRDPGGALQRALEWWKALSSPPTNEDLTLNEMAPYIRAKLAKEHLPNLTLNEFERVCAYTHATKDHISKEDFIKPAQKVLREANGVYGKAELRGQHLDARTLEELSRSAAATGDDAAADLRVREKGKTVRKRLSGNPIVLAHENIEGNEEKRALLSRLRHLYDRIRGVPEQ